MSSASLARSIVVVVLWASSSSSMTTIVDARRSSSTSSPLPSPPSSGRRLLPSFVVHRAIRSTVAGGGGDARASSNFCDALLLRAAATSSSSSSAAAASAPPTSTPSSPALFRHTLAILTTPAATSDRILNEAILDASLSSTSPTGRLSVVLRTSKSLKYEDGHTLSELRTYVGEVYSFLWDRAVGSDDDDVEEKEGGTEVDDRNRGFASTGNLMDVIVYPQNLPNAAPEQWIVHRPSLEAICSSDRITGWSSEGTAGGSGASHANVDGEGRGGLDEHVIAVNDDRRGRGLGRVSAIHVEEETTYGDDDENVVFLEDEEEGTGASSRRAKNARNDDEEEEEDATNGGGRGMGLGVILGGTRIPSASLFRKVAAGGTFDGMHYGHRKLLTLAVSSVEPNIGRLLVGVTIDDMLRTKSYAEHIPPLDERMKGVKEFLYDLAPGMKNRIKVGPISDPYGPPGADPNDTSSEVPNDFDALVLSHETLPTGRQLNKHRVENLGLRPLKLLCTRRTEPHGMSSTALRRIRSMRSVTSGTE